MTGSKKKPKRKRLYYAKPKKEPEMILYKPNGEKYAHIFHRYFKGGVGKTLCGRTVFTLCTVSNGTYKASEHCPQCEEALRIMEEHKNDY